MLLTPQRTQAHKKFYNPLGTWDGNSARSRSRLSHDLSSIIYILTYYCCEMLCRICTVQIKPRKRDQLHADYTAPARQHELYHTDHELSICPERARSWSVIIDHELSICPERARSWSVRGARTATESDVRQRQQHGDKSPFASARSSYYICLIGQTDDHLVHLGPDLPLSDVVQDL